MCRVLISVLGMELCRSLLSWGQKQRPPCQVVTATADGKGVASRGGVGERNVSGSAGT